MLLNIQSKLLFCLLFRDINKAVIQVLRFKVCQYIKHGNKRTVICTYIQACMALLKMDNNVVSDKLKVSHSLTSGGTFVVYTVHTMCSDGYIKIVCSKVKLQSLK